MKATSDAKLNKVIQWFKALLQNHNHDGVYSYGALRTYNSKKQEPITITLETKSDKEKWYIVLIGRNADDYDGSLPSCVSVVIDWQMIPSGETGIAIKYKMGESDEGGSIVASKGSDGNVTFLLNSTDGHYIRQVCGYL